ncbi:hypothetical protein [Phaeovulum sp. W22_SRMD_FR3]|uniref:hypothetical protein n=1 Tax=Phaeovulum sp. W22_SRMD_FR3 TaxID=3240274 RepID=UPI003F9B3739
MRAALETDQVTPFTAVAVSQAWVPVRHPTLVVERQLSQSVEQRIGLRNETAMAGDNFMALRAEAFDGRSAGRLRYEDFIAAVGGLPAPFEQLRPGDLLSGEDDIGTYLWAEERRGDSRVCVLALRRLDDGVRQLPRGASALDILLRNCVNGTAEMALRPIMAETLLSDAAIGASPLRGTIQMLSPLAGPTP